MPDLKDINLAHRVIQGHVSRTPLLRSDALFDNPHVLAGQGTIGLEILEDLPNTDMVFAGLSGGGLLGGIGLAVKEVRAEVRVVGVSMEHGAAMIESLEAGRPVQVEEQESFADSLGGGIGLKNRWTFDTVRRVIDDYYRVSEEAIAWAMSYFLEHEKMRLEGAAVVAVAAIDQHAVDVRGRRVVFVLSGNNVTTETIEKATLMSGEYGAGI